MKPDATLENCPRCGTKLTYIDGQPSCLMCGWHPGESTEPMSGADAAELNKQNPYRLDPEEAGKAAPPAEQPKAAGVNPINSANILNPANPEDPSESKVPVGEATPVQATAVPPEEEADLLSTSDFALSGASGGGSSFISRKMIIIAVVVLILLIPTLSFGFFQLQAQSAISKAKKDLQSHQYAAASKDLAFANSSFVLPGTRNQIKDLKDKASRWANDQQLVESAKQLMTQNQPDDAINLLSQVDQDYPQYDDVQKLLALAKDQQQNPDMTVSTDQLDNIAPDSSSGTDVASGDNSTGDLSGGGASSGDGSSAGDSGGGDTGGGLPNGCGDGTLNNQCPPPPPPPPPPVPSGCGPGTLNNKCQKVALYSYYSDKFKDHVATIVRADSFYWNNNGYGHYDAAQKKMVMGPEGVLGYVLPSQVKGSVPLQAYYSGGATDSMLEVNGPAGSITNNGHSYNYTSRQGFVFSSQLNGTTPLCRYYSGGATDNYNLTNCNTAGLRVFGYNFVTNDGYIFGP